MHMGADDRRHDGLAVECDPRAAGRQGNVAFAADSRDRAALDQQRRIVDCRAAVARNDARAFEQNALRGRRLCCKHGDHDGDAERCLSEHA
jgi:hypothetical protein